MKLPHRPTIYEINTAVWLRELGAQNGNPALLLDQVPDAVWDALAALPVDAVWLMGVWQRSPAGLAIASTNDELMAGMREALPDLQSEDIIGSPYCVRDYSVDPRFGGQEALAVARAELAERGVGLILDYVPNHVAPDHPWLSDRPEVLLGGTEDDLAAHPEAFLKAPGGIFARGRDPYFAPWPDVVQVNAFSPDLRSAIIDLLSDLATQCDGLRCDMAMLMCNEIFARTWGDRGGEAPELDYWPQVIGAVKAAHPDFTFIAEAYWDMEWTLQQQGFDYCYDKRLYDRLEEGSAQSVLGHLHADPEYSDKLLRFIENHDEPRAAATFGTSGRARAAAVAISTLPGARMYYDGQFEGRTVRPPVFLDRAPVEPVDDDLQAFYLILVSAVAQSGLQEGTWSLAGVAGWPDNDSGRDLLAWSWDGPFGTQLVVVNFSDHAAQARVKPTVAGLGGTDWTLTDHLSDQRFERSGDDLAGEGLYVDLPPWGFHFLGFSPMA